MNPLLVSISEHGESLNILLLIGLAILLGSIGAKVFQKFAIPQIVGYVVIGLVIGQSGFNLLSEHTVETLSAFSTFALGIIGFMIGGELKREIFKKHGKQFFIILCSEGIAAFVLVGLLTGFGVWYFSGNVNTSVAMGLVLGAIASATAPAATVNVLWEYKTRGPLTSTLLAIVALDDCLALLLYGIASSIAAAFLGDSDGSMLSNILVAIFEIVGSIFLGILVGWALSFVLKKTKEPDKALVFTLSAVLLVIGISIALGLGTILAAMILGVTVTNLAPRQRKSTFGLIEAFSPPVYALFFVLAGAHIVLGEISGWMLGIVGVYLIGRCGGKIAGSWFGAKMAGASDSVRKYLGICLLSQAGVAIGLAIISSRLFAGEIGHAIIIIVMATTLVVELVGPLCVKLGVKKAGEVGLNVTEEDLIATCKVCDVMDSQIPAIEAGMSLNEVIQIVSETDSFYYCVIDSEHKLIGSMTLYGIKNTFATQELNDWLVALDIMEPVVGEISAEMDLSEAFRKMDKLHIDFVPVVESQDSDKYVGIISSRKVHRQLSAKVLAHQKEADLMSASRA
ncbi:MAG: CBS domain-containing protein [Planctomycetes bacterium]|nr:CBS domain-containing protein [Planctomycetota bacterium]